MKKLALIAALLLATSPVAAQVVTGTTTGTSTGTTTGTTTGTSTGVICIEMMLATFCNVPTAPNTSGGVVTLLKEEHENSRLEHNHATVTASRHTFIAAARKARCVLAEMR